MIRGAAVATLAISAALVALSALACSDDDDEPAPSPAAPAAGDATAGPTDAAVTYAPAGPVTFKVIAGRAEGNRDVEAFMPADIRIRAGDSIEWTAQGFEGHTISFGDDDDVLASFGDYLLPNPDDATERIFNPQIALRSERQTTHDGTSEFINSGFIGVPAEQTYQLTFEEEGLYTYLCLVHPFTMNGTVTVEAPGAQVESPETLSARAQDELQAHFAELDEQAGRVAEAAQTATGPDGTTIHYVQTGVITDHGQMAVYLPGSIDIRTGDTVIFQNDDRNFHNVVFKGGGELPPGVGILVDPGGRGINYLLDNASAVAVDPPPEGFDETTFLSSGSLGVLQPRLTWTVRFTTPGTYLYACTIHVLAGMTGVVEVTAR